MKALISLCVLVHTDVVNTPAQWAEVTATWLHLSLRHSQAKGIPFSNISLQSDKQALWAQSNRRILLLRASVKKHSFTQWEGDPMLSWGHTRQRVWQNYWKLRSEELSILSQSIEYQKYICHVYVQADLTCFLGAGSNSRQELSLFSTRCRCAPCCSEQGEPTGQVMLCCGPLLGGRVSSCW